MSNIYLQEPGTSGKVCLHTTAGDIDVELWARECPKACRNFVQHCLDGYYDGTIFHRVVKGFIVQGGDPTGTGTGGESIYGEPFRDEFHQRLKFVRRGLVAMANAGKHDNGSQFFFTLDKTPELEKKHTIFGKITGNTIFNVISMGDVEVDAQDRPLHPHKIKQVTILDNPFPDVKSRSANNEVKSREGDDEKRKSHKPKSTARATTNKNLLSFANEEEEEVVSTPKSKKSKSAHDILDDKTLSREQAVEKEVLERNPNRRSRSRTKSRTPDLDEKKSERDFQKVKERLDKHKPTSKDPEKVKIEPKKQDSDSEEEEGEYEIWSEKKTEERKKMDDVKAEISKLKGELKRSEKSEDSVETESHKHPAVQDLVKEREYFKEKVASVPPKRSGGRQEHTMNLLDKFISRIQKPEVALLNQPVVDKVEETENLAENPDKMEDEEEPEDFVDDSWMRHTFRSELQEQRHARDANVESEDTYSVYDPRHPANRRRRGEFESKQGPRKKKGLVDY